jgi:hypothetical protein
MDKFKNFYDNAEDGNLPKNLRLNKHDSSQTNSQHQLVPLEFAKQHIKKIEEDMKNMHERHEKLMRAMEENYNMIEQETQEYYVEFFQKWREVA